MDRRPRSWSSGHVRWSVVVVLLALALPALRVETVAAQDVGRPVAVAQTAPDDDASRDDAPARTTDSRADDERTAVRVVNAYWRSWFAQQGARYRPPIVKGGYTGRGGPRCGGEPSVPGNAYYCPSANFLAWDENLMRAGYTQIGDAWVYLVIAHEWGHAIQAQLPRRLVSQAVELQADCLAGAALAGAARDRLVRIEPGDGDEIAQALEAVADDYPWTNSTSHGDAQERTSAFQTGVNRGVDTCLRA